MEDLMECFRLEGPGGNDPLFFIISKGGFRVGHKSVGLFLYDDSASIYLFNIPIGGVHTIAKRTADMSREPI